MRNWSSTLKRYRSKYVLTVEEAAAKCGVSVSAWRKYEAGTRFPSIRTQKGLMAGGVSWTRAKLPEAGGE